MAPPYQIMQDIEDYNRHDGMNKQVNDAITKIHMVNLVSARQNEAVIALAKLQCYGITENQILNLCKIIEMNGHNMAGAELPKMYMSSKF